MQAQFFYFGMFLTRYFRFLSIFIPHKILVESYELYDKKENFSDGSCCFYCISSVGRRGDVDASITQTAKISLNEGAWIEIDGL